MTALSRTTIVFCDVCDNMMHARFRTKADDGAVDRDHQADNSSTMDMAMELYCKNCGSHRLMPDGHVISSRSIQSGDAVDPMHFIHPHMKHDPSMPLSRDMECPNRESCPVYKNEGEQALEQSVMYAKYDHDNMRYVYMCTHCDTVFHGDGTIVSSRAPLTS